MNNLGATAAKIVALTGGAVAGALLARWCDEFISSRAQQRSSYDRERYSQGLQPIMTTSTQRSEPITIEHQPEEYEG